MIDGRDRGAARVEIVNRRLVGRGVGGDEIGASESATDERVAWSARARGDELVQVIGDGLRGRVAVGGEFFDHPHDDPLEGARHLGGAAMERNRRIAPDALRGGALVFLVAPLERASAGDELIEDDAEREDVAPCVDDLAEDLLRRHVRGGSEGGRFVDARQRLVGARQALALRDPKVGDLHVAPLRDHDVRGLDVAMNDAARVGVREAGRDVGAEGRDDLRRETVRLRGDRREAPPVDVLEHEVHRIVRLDEVEQHGDVRVAQRRQDVRFPFELRGER